MPPVEVALAVIKASVVMHTGHIACLASRWNIAPAIAQRE